MKLHDNESSSGKKKAPYVIAPMLKSPLQRTLWDSRSEDSTRSSSSAAGSMSYEVNKIEKRGSQAAQSVWSTAIFGAQKSGEITIERTYVQIVLASLQAPSVRMWTDLN